MSGGIAYVREGRGHAWHMVEKSSWGYSGHKQVGQSYYHIDALCGRFPKRFPIRRPAWPEYREKKPTDAVCKCCLKARKK